MHQGTTTPWKDGDVGRITTPVLIRNNLDVEKAEVGELPSESVRQVEVADALVDTGASTLCLPPSLIVALGLHPVERRPSRTAAGMREATVYSTVRVSLPDFPNRNSVSKAVEIPEESPVLLGQFPLEELDLVVHPKEQKLTTNPLHGKEWVLEIY